MRLRLALVLAWTASAASAQTPVPKTSPNMPKSLNIPPITVIAFTIPTGNVSGRVLYPGQRSSVQVGPGVGHPAPLSITLRYSGALTGPASVSLPSGAQISAAFDVTALAVSTNTVSAIRAWIIDSTRAKAETLYVQPAPGSTPCQPRPAILAPNVTRRNADVTITIALGCAPPVATAVQVTSANPGVIPPPPGNVVTIPARASSVSYTTTTGNVQATTIVTLSAFIPGTNPIVRAPDKQIAVSP